MGTRPAPDRLGQDLLSKADAIHRQTAWAQALEAIGDAESGRDLAAVLADDQKHRDALLESFKRMVEKRRERTTNPERRCRPRRTEIPW